jgi:hypothetical protein
VHYCRRNTVWQVILHSPAGATLRAHLTKQHNLNAAQGSCDQPTFAMEAGEGTGHPPMVNTPHQHQHACMRSHADQMGCRFPDSRHQQNACTTAQRGCPLAPLCL